ncbi:MAG TPA: TRAP transporter small permease [Xanthobacteraceae bacterium]
MTRLDVAGMIAALSRSYGRLLDGLLLVACALLLLMTFLIGADVLLRNIGAGGIAPSNELSEDLIYLVTLLAAPALLRHGQHIRVDIVLRLLPGRVGWLLEWLGDGLGLVCCLYFVWYGARVTLASLASGALSIKTLILPEWWLLAPMPAAFVLLGIEFLFRMHRLALAERRPREDAVSAS